MTDHPPPPRRESFAHITDRCDPVAVDRDEWRKVRAESPYPTVEYDPNDWRDLT